MKRRDFLQKAGLVATGATNILAPCAASEAVDSEVRSRRSADASDQESSGDLGPQRFGPRHRGGVER